MAAPLAPIAWTALRVGAVAATAWYIRSRTRPAPKHIWRERAMDDAPEGIDLTAQRAEGEANTHASARIKRTIRFGSGPGVEVDVSALGRVRIRRAD